jgi:hypothetical protein
MVGEARRVQSKGIKKTRKRRKSQDLVDDGTMWWTQPGFLK